MTGGLKRDSRPRGSSRFEESLSFVTLREDFGMDTNAANGNAVVLAGQESKKNERDLAAEAVLVRSVQMPAGTETVKGETNVAGSFPSIY